MKTGWFVYKYVDPRNSNAIYVGKGKYSKTGEPRRMFYHWKKLDTLNNQLLKSVLVKIREAGLIPLMTVDSDYAEERRAFRREIELIKLYGLKIDGTGTLRNLSYGGEGWGGQVWTDSRKKKVSESIKKAYQRDPAYLKALIDRHANPEFKCKIKTAIKASLNAPGMREKLSKAIRDGQSASGAKDKISKASKKHWQNAEYRAKVLSAQKARVSTEAHRKLVSKATKGRWDDPEYKARVSTAIKEGRSTEESRAKTRSQAKNQWTAEKRAEMSAIMKAVLVSPELKAQRAEALRQRWAKRKEQGLTRLGGV